MTLREKLRVVFKQPHWERERMRAGLPRQMVVASVEDLITDIIGVVEEHLEPEQGSERSYKVNK